MTKYHLFPRETCSKVEQLYNSRSKKSAELKLQTSEKAENGINKTLKETFFNLLYVCNLIHINYRHFKMRICSNDACWRQHSNVLWLQSKWYLDFYWFSFWRILHSLGVPKSQTFQKHPIKYKTNKRKLRNFTPNNHHDLSWWAKRWITIARETQKTNKFKRWTSWKSI